MTTSGVEGRVPVEEGRGVKRGREAKGGLRGREIRQKTHEISPETANFLERMHQPKKISSDEAKVFLKLFKNLCKEGIEAGLAKELVELLRARNIFEPKTEASIIRHAIKQQNIELLASIIGKDAHPTIQLREYAAQHQKQLNDLMELIGDTPGFSHVTRFLDELAATAGPSRKRARPEELKEKSQHVTKRVARGTAMGPQVRNLDDLMMLEKLSLHHPNALGPARLGLLGTYMSLDSSELAEVIIENKNNIRDELAMMAAELDQAGVKKEELPFLSELRTAFRDCLRAVKKAPEQYTDKVQDVETFCNAARLAFGHLDENARRYKGDIEGVLLAVGEMRLAKELEAREAKELKLGVDKLAPDLKRTIGAVSKFVVRELSAAHTYTIGEEEYTPKEIKAPPKEWNKHYRIQYDRTTGDVSLASSMIGEGAYKEVLSAVFVRGTEPLRAAALYAKDKERGALEIHIEKREEKMLCNPQFRGVAGMPQVYELTPHVGGQWKTPAAISMMRYDNSLDKLPRDLTKKEVVDVLKQISSGLYALHHYKNEKNEEDPIFHFDLKLQNMLFRIVSGEKPGERKFEAVLTDFGLYVQQSEEIDINDPRFWVVGEQHQYGSGFYPPELCAESIDISTLDYAKTEIWVCGNEFLALLTRLNIRASMPEHFSSLDARDKRAAIERVVGRTFHEAYQLIPQDRKDLVNLCKKMMESDPKKRFSVDDVIKELDRISA